MDVKTARALIPRLNLIGADPLAIERHFQAMTGTIHPYRPNYPFISGIDIALWDVAGKILDLPIYKLMGGPLRDAVEMYSHGDTLKDMGSPESCREWAEWNRAQPEGFKTFKIEPLQALPGEQRGARDVHRATGEDRARLCQRARGGGGETSTSPSTATTSTTSPAPLRCPEPPRKSTLPGSKTR